MVASIRTIDGFLKYVASIEPGRDINNGRRGSEENVKMKFVVPLLEYLGFDRLKDMDFEMQGADVVLKVEGKVRLIVECKGWEEEPTGHLRQCLEYSLKSGIPYILVTAGRANALFTSLGNSSDLGLAKPIVEFAYKDLVGPSGRRSLRRLEELIGKKSLRSGSHALRRAIRGQLPAGASLSEVERRFRRKCAQYKPRRKNSRLTEEQFRKEAGEHPKGINQALMQLRQEIKHVSRHYTKVMERYRSRNIGLEYVDTKRLRRKKRGLFGVYPKDGHVSFALESWRQLGLSKGMREAMKSHETVPRKVTSAARASKISQFLRRALAEIEGERLMPR